MGVDGCWKMPISGWGLNPDLPWDSNKKKELASSSLKTFYDRARTRCKNKRKGRQTEDIIRALDRSAVRTLYRDDTTLH